VWKTLDINLLHLYSYNIHQPLTASKKLTEARGRAKRVRLKKLFFHSFFPKLCVNIRKKIYAIPYFSLSRSHFGIALAE